MEEKIIYQIALSMLPGVGPVLAKNLLSYCGSAEAIFKERKGRLLKIPEIGPVTAEAIIKQNVLNRAETEFDFVQKKEIEVLFFSNEDYPVRLKNCPDSPILLYYKGTKVLNSEKIIAVVGTRNATEFGRKLCDKIIEGLVDQGVMILSGLAYGMDITAHSAALKYKLPTVGVLAHGLDKLYPSMHHAVATEMIKHGGLLSEYPSKIKPDRENFPTRNRIVAGMADAVLVVESGKKGGSLITAEIANTYHRDVFAVPGKVGEMYSEGCNWLIKSNKAGLVESAADIIFQMGWEKKMSINKPGLSQQKLFPEMNEDEKKLFDFLEKNGKSDIDFLCSELMISQSKAASLLLNMEFAGIIKSLPGKSFELK